MPDNRTPEQRRADLRAQVARVLSGALETGDRGAWAEMLGISHQHLDQCAAAAKQLHVADVLVAPEAVKRALAQLIVGDACAIVELPKSNDAADDFRLVANAQRESGEAISATLEAIADGRIGADEGARLVKECDEAIASLLAVRERGRSAVRNRVIGIRAVQR